MWVPSSESQWHHQMIGVDAELLAESTGGGVVVGIYDTGVDLDHPDLEANIRLELSYSGPYGSHNGTAGSYPSRADSHGTAVASIIGAKGNGFGVMGVAPNAGLVSIDWYDDLFDSSRSALDAISFGSRFDVTNWSIAFSPNYGGSRDVNGGGFGDKVASRVDDILADGRDGLGTIMVKAAGNARSSSAPETTTGNAQSDWMNQFFGSIVVAATDQRGDAAFYSSYGSNVLIAGPAATAVADPVGDHGAAEGDYRNNFSGTSAATPVVSGVVSLLLSANPELGWRDVQEILALSAAHTGSSLVTPGRRGEVGGWMITGSDNWNGGGMSHHLSYGYGMVDARAALAMAESWGVIHGEAATSRNLQSTKVSRSLDITLAAGHHEIALKEETDLDIEHIELRLDMRHNDFSEFHAWLVAPDGTRFMLNDGDTHGERVRDTVTFTIAAARGLTSAGEWRIEMEDETGDGVAQLAKAELVFFGAPASSDDVHYLTDDFMLYRDHERDRGRIVDSDGGTDWLHLGAVSGAVNLDLSAKTLSVSDEFWARIDGYENVLSGRGDDVVQGNARDNKIYTGRGDDVVAGGAGADVLNGGAGRDFVNYFGASSGVVVNFTAGDGRFGWAEGDRLAEIEDMRGTGLSDGLTGDRNANMLIGAAGDDRIDGRGNHDILIGGDGDDHLIGGGGNDVLSAGLGADRLEGNEGNDRLVGSADGEAFEGGTGNDTIFAAGGNDSLAGGSGADLLDGGAGDDRLTGDGGNDHLIGGGGADKFVFNIASGRDIIADFELGKDRLLIAASLVPNDLDTDIALNVAHDGSVLAWEGGEVFLEEISVTSDMLTSIFTIL